MSFERDIEAAVRVLRSGGLILYPTDTIWGIGCDATNEVAVQRIFALKRRAESKAMICLVDSAGRLQRYVRDVPAVAWDLLDCVERPTTIILDGGVNVAPSLLGEDGSIALRITKEPFSRQLCYRFERAIVSTSANISGEAAAQNYRDISEEIISGVDYVCLSRRGEHKPHDPSSIIKLGRDGEIKIIRR